MTRSKYSLCAKNEIVKSNIISIAIQENVNFSLNNNIKEFV